MRTIRQVVEDIIERSPFLAEVLSEGLANNAEIARRIQPDVEKKLLESVSEAAIGMALHRIEKDLRTPSFGTRFLKRLNDITVRSNLVELTYPNSVELAHSLETFSRAAQKRKSTFINFSRGLHETLIILDAESEQELKPLIAKTKGVKRLSGLSAITLHLPEESLRVPGVYYPVLKALATEGISFVEVMSIRTELSIIFEDKDVDRAFSTLKRITS